MQTCASYVLCGLCVISLAPSFSHCLTWSDGHDHWSHSVVDLPLLLRRHRLRDHVFVVRVGIVPRRVVLHRAAVRTLHHSHLGARQLHSLEDELLEGVVDLWKTSNHIAVSRRTTKSHPPTFRAWQTIDCVWSCTTAHDCAICNLFKIIENVSIITLLHALMTLFYVPSILLLYMFR